MIIGEAPGHREDASGRPFVGRSGHLLDEALAEVGLDRKDIFISNAVHCRPPDNRTPKKKEIAACRYWLDQELAAVKPKFLLLLGNVALQSVLNTTGIKKLRGRPIEHDGYVVLPTYHPSFILRSEDTGRSLRPHFIKDLKLLKTMIDFGGIPEERAVRLTIVDTPHKARTMLKACRGVVSFDLETTCLYPWDKDAGVVLMGIGTREGEFVVPLAHPESVWKGIELADLLSSISLELKDCIVVMQNGKFDALWMKVHYGLTLRNDFDTMLAHYLLDENLPHDLTYIAHLYFGAHDWDIPLPEKQGGAPLAKISKYAAHDLYYTRKAYFKLKAELHKEGGVERLFNKIMMPITNLTVKMEERGLYIDLDRMDKTGDYLDEEVTKAVARLNRWGKINWASPKQVAKLLYDDLRLRCSLKTKKGAQSTSESALKQIDHPCVDDLLKLRGARQQRSFFVEGWKPYLDHRRLHPSIKLHGTVTGRPSCEHPNAQQIPRDTRIRSNITAPPGYVLLEGDLSQIELRIIAHIANESTMIEAFNKGTDIHWLTALRELQRGLGLPRLVCETARIARQMKKAPLYAEAIDILHDIGPDTAIDIDSAWKEVRKKAKSVNFGYSYGMWWKKFITYARDNYDIKLTEREAQESRSAFFAMYQLEPWHNRQRRIATSEGYVRTLTQRKRRLPNAQSPYDSPERGEAWRQAINSPVQGTASDFNLMVLIQLAEEFPPPIFYPVLTVHDSILGEVKISHAIRVAERMEEIMKRPALFDDFDIDLRVPIGGETKLGPWGSGISLQKWIDNQKSSS